MRKMLLSTGHSNANGASAFTLGTWERYYKDSTWIITKGGLTDSMAAQVCLFTFNLHPFDASVMDCDTDCDTGAFCGHFQVH